MAYTLPQVLVEQRITRSPVSALFPRRALIVGPNAYLSRFSVKSERELSFLGYYDSVVDTSYSWPNRPNGAKIDLGYTKVFMTDALLRYFGPDVIGSGEVITVDRTNYAKNRIRSANFNFKANGPFYPTAPALLDRGVKTGDIVKVRGITTSNEVVTLWTYVKAIHADPIAAIVSPAIPDANNAGATSASAVVTQIAGPNNCIVATGNATNYSGLASGYNQEVYTITVLESSIGGDLTTARLRVISASGTDNVSNVTPAAAGNPTPIGTRGLTVTFDYVAGSCSDSASESLVSPNDLTVGQVFRVTVTAAHTPAVATSGGVYTGVQDDTYLVTVTRGGRYASSAPPQITVSTLAGLDISSPVTITAAGTPFPVGSRGVNVSFSGTGLRKGDRYYIPVTAVSSGPYRILELGHNLDDDLADGTEVDLTLFIKVPELEITEKRVNTAPLRNWVASEQEIVLKSGITALYNEWTNNGNLVPLSVFSEPEQGYGKAYVEYRAWLSTISNQINTIENIDGLDEIPGPLTPDNPLKYAVNIALANSLGTGVSYGAVADPESLDSWADILEKAFTDDGFYNLCPLTNDRDVHELFIAHVNSASTPEQALWRRVWVSLPGFPTIPIVSAGSDVPGYRTATTSDGQIAKATVSDDPNTGGADYVLVTLRSNNFNFVAGNVRPGDIFRVNFNSDGYGGVIYENYTIAAVINSDTLRLATSLPAPINVATKFEIWRNLSVSDEAEAIANYASSYGNRRVSAVWPDTAEIGNSVVAGYYVAAALAGLASGVLPHQPLTRVELSGITSVPRTNRKFNKAQLNKLAEGGVCVVTQEEGTPVFIRHCVTTGNTNNVFDREEMPTRNLDSISYRIFEYLDPFIGRTNVTPATQARIRAELEVLLGLLQIENANNDIGGQLISWEIVKLEPNPIFKDRYDLVLALELPFPLNNIKVTLELAL